MDQEALYNRLLNPQTSVDEAEQLTRVVKPLPAPQAFRVVKRLEAEAETYWHRDAQSALVLANRMIRIGELRQGKDILGWGHLARANALLFWGRDKGAWDDYEQAAELFQAVDEKVGWARTRSGSLMLSLNFGNITKALDQAAVAGDIFNECGEPHRLLQLEINLGGVYDLLGEYKLAIEVNQRAIETALQLGEAAQSRLATLYYNTGYAHLYAGDFQQARVWITKAQETWRQRGEMHYAYLSDINLAYVNQAQGDYRRALERLYEIREYFQSEGLWSLHADANREIVECYLCLNRFEEARDLAEITVSDYRKLENFYDMGPVLVQLASAQAELSNLSAAQHALDEAETIFGSQGAQSWQALIRLRHGRLALRQGDLTVAQSEADTASLYFSEHDERTNYAKTILLIGEILLAKGDVLLANQRANEALQIARQGSLPALQYAAYLLLGHIAEAQSKTQRALRCYFAAATTLDRVQRQLTLTLRPDFLEDKVEALRAAIRLCLASQQTKRAFDLLEWAKSQTYLGYVLGRENLSWLKTASPTLVEELSVLRTQHQWFYRLAYNQLRQQTDQNFRLNLQRMQPEVTAREKRIRTLTERLYLQREIPLSMDRPSLNEISCQLATDTVLIEFYNDGDKLWAFTLDYVSLQFHELAISVNELNELISALEFNFNMTLNLQASSEMLDRLIVDAQEQLTGLYNALLAPLAFRFEGRKRLIIVPYGAIHYLPINLLHTGQQYLIERYEIVVLPSAALAVQEGPKRPQGGALVLAHSDDDKLPYTTREGNLVHSQFGGKLYCDDLATRAMLESPPRQILHIAAHGEHRIDQPDLSYIQLADGQLWVDDLVQLDLSYELITLSACETGRSRVTAWDDIIGIGRGFLMAGAGALVVTLWRVPDDIAYEFMEHFYTALRGGLSKAEALQASQKTFSTRWPTLHPALWGAFQLIGDASPLSS